MLRISGPTEAGSPVTLRVEGALAGDWVPLLQAECVRHLDAWKSVELDISQLRFVDRDGVAMVHGLLARGVRVVGASPLVNALLGLGAARRSPDLAIHQSEVKMSQRSNALADRLVWGARALADFASTLTDVEWHTRIPGDGRTVGVVVHHVASVYPIETQLAQTLARGEAITGVTMDDVHAMNAAHARDNDGVTKEAALDLLRHNSALAATAIRALGDEQLDRAAPASLYGDAVLTCQFVLEDHAIRHSYHHLARIRSALRPRMSAALAR